jgi:hypothetical protein
MTQAQREQELALAYLRACEQDKADLEFMTGIVESGKPEFYKSVVDINYMMGIHALQIVRGERKGRYEILQKIGTP